MGYRYKNYSVSGRLVTSFIAAAANLGAAVLHLGSNASPVLALGRGRLSSAKSNRQDLQVAYAVLRKAKLSCNETEKGQIDLSEAGVHAAEKLMA